MFFPYIAGKPRQKGVVLMTRKDVIVGFVISVFVVILLIFVSAKPSTSLSAKARADSRPVVAEPVGPPSPGVLPAVHPTRDRVFLQK